MIKKRTVLITGANGFVGSALRNLLSNVSFLIPSRSELDCTNGEMVHAYIAQHSPDVIIHAAAYTNNTKAEEDRGNTQGECYRVNVDGTKHIMRAARASGAYTIFISTGSVFAGTISNPGPFSELDSCGKDIDLSWYAFTKREAEKEIEGYGAIIRLSHPLYGGATEDYLHTMISLYKANTLYPLFTDQLFPLSDMVSVAKGIQKLIEKKYIGIFHIVSTDCVSPFDLCTYAFQKAGLSGVPLQGVSFDEFAIGRPLAKRYTKYCAISGGKTSDELGLPAYSWKDVVDASMSY